MLKDFIVHRMVFLPERNTLIVWARGRKRYLEAGVLRACGPGFWRNPIVDGLTSHQKDFAAVVLGPSRGPGVELRHRIIPRNPSLLLADAASIDV